MGFRLAKQSRRGRRGVLNIMRITTIVLQHLAAATFLLAASGSSQAQSTDECMSARTDDALRICQSIIDGGGASADIYWKLSSAQYQNGQGELANRTLDTALGRYPRDSRLQSLKQIITTDSSEQAMIARSARLNQNSLDKGALKITCLTKTGDIGISACKRRLELTSQDGDRMRERLALLQELQQSSRLATVAVSEPPARIDTSLIETPEPEPFAEPDSVASNDNTDIQNPQSDAESLAEAAERIAQARREAYKSLVKDVQARLNEFGFDAGFPDGVPGRNTRRALSEFYVTIGSSPSTSITDLTLEDLQNEERKLNLSTRLIEESQKALDSGDLERARNQLERAQKTSALVRIPVPLAQSLRLPTVADVIAPATGQSGDGALTTASTGADSRPASDTQTSLAKQTTAAVPVQPAGNSTATAQLSELLGRINVLHGRIRRQEADQQQQFETLREAL